MSDSSNEMAVFELVAEILIRCFWYSIILLTLTLLIFLLARDAAYQVHSMIFGVTKHDFVLMFYYGAAFLKITAVTLFLIPYAAIRVVLKKHRDKALR